jgi:hypothetical protein
MLPDEFAHTESGPTILQIGIGFMVTVLLQLLVQPFLVTYNVRIKVPGLPAVMVIVGVLRGAGVKAFPEIDHE